MEPETLPRLVQPNFTGFVPDTAEPEPDFIVAQPTASATTRSNPALQVIRAKLDLPWLKRPDLDLQECM